LIASKETGKKMFIAAKKCVQAINRPEIFWQIKA